LQVDRIEPAHLPCQSRNVTRKDVGDQPASPLGQRDGDEPAIVTPALLLHERPADEVAHDDRGVAVAAQKFLAKIALTQRPVVQERLQHAELADGETGGGHHPADARGHGLGRPHQLDVSVERRRFRRGAAIPRRHRSNSNEFLRPAPGVVNRPRGIAR
jgi:hypothetical protein